jgi:hypothetical protein
VPQLIVRAQFMNPFVDLRKRGVELPPGCKDLIDVLRLASTKLETAAVKPGAAEVPETGLGDLERYVARLLASPARFRSLWIEGDPGAVIGLFCDKRGLRTLIMVDAEREQSIRSVVTASAISPIQDHALAPNGPCSRALFLPLPMDAPCAVKCVRELLTKGLGMPETISLEFKYHEKKEP